MRAARLERIGGLTWLHIAPDPKCRRCGHPKDTHRHLRSRLGAGLSNCGLCNCPMFKRKWPWSRVGYG